MVGRSGGIWLLCFAPWLATLLQILNIQHHFHTALVALARILRDRSRDDVVEPWRQFGIKHRRRHRITVDYFECDREGAVSLKGPVTCQDRVQNHAERK